MESLWYTLVHLRYPGSILVSTVFSLNGELADQEQRVKTMRPELLDEIKVSVENNFFNFVFSLIFFLFFSFQLLRISRQNIGFISRTMEE